MHSALGSFLIIFLAFSSLIDGAGLLCGVLKHFMDRGPDCPKVLAATHFHDVFREDLLDPETVPISFLHMQVMFTSSTGMDMTSTSLDESSQIGTPSARRDSLQRGDTGKTIGPGEKITYLYR